MIEQVDYQIKVSDSGRRMAQGKCPRCTTKVNRILGKDSPMPIPQIIQYEYRIRVFTRARYKYTKFWDLERRTSEYSSYGSIATGRALTNFGMKRQIKKAQKRIERGTKVSFYSLDWKPL
jgi:hypothetical protein